MAFLPCLLELRQPMYTLVFFTFSLISLSLLCFSLYKRLRRTEGLTQNSISEDKPCDPCSPHLTHSLLLEILPSNSAKWEGFYDGCNPVDDGSGVLGGERAEGDSGGEQREKKKKKKRVKKKRAKGGEDGVEEKTKEKEKKEKEKEKEKEKQELVCLYPFTSSSSATQRKIKQQYDQLVKCHGSKGLTLAQVGQFANCLIEARNELQHKSEVIQRKFTITKALLCKADRSSFDRLRQQIYKLEMEKKRLDEDAFVYNWLQQQLKLSPAYKKMLEISASMELKAKSGELTEGTDSTDTEFSDISFEELLAQEKKDSFWQKNGKPRPCLS